MSVSSKTRFGHCVVIAPHLLACSELRPKRPVHSEGVRVGDRARMGWRGGTAPGARKLKLRSHSILHVAARSRLCFTPPLSCTKRSCPRLPVTNTEPRPRALENWLT